MKLQKPEAKTDTNCFCLVAHRRGAGEKEGSTWQWIHRVNKKKCWKWLISSARLWSSDSVLKAGPMREIISGMDNENKSTKTVPAEFLDNTNVSWGFTSCHSLSQEKFLSYSHELLFLAPIFGLHVKNWWDKRWAVMLCVNSRGCYFSFYTSLHLSAVVKMKLNGYGGRRRGFPSWGCTASFKWYLEWVFKPF